jgi:hypothetical protein
VADADWRRGPLFYTLSNIFQAVPLEIIMKILLIGATGQIGYALTNALSQTAHQTSILVRNAHSLAFPANVNVLGLATGPAAVLAGPHAPARIKHLAFLHVFLGL